MPQLIKQRLVADDRWNLVREAAALTDLPDGVPVFVPLKLWIERRAALIARGDVGVWLAPDEDPAAVAADVARLPHRQRHDDCTGRHLSRGIAHQRPAIVADVAALNELRRHRRAP